MAQKSTRPKTAKSAHAGSKPAPPGPLICVIDDDVSVRESLPDLLKAIGYTVRTFASAESFLASDAIQDACCLVLDVSMPGMTGPELHRELSGRGLRVPVIFITANRDEGVRSRLLSQGAVECLFKPFSEPALQQALKLALSRRGVPRRG